MSRRSRNKGYRAERNLVIELRRHGIRAVRVPLSGACEGFSGDLLVEGKTAEVKARHNGFRELYKWLENRDLLFLKADFKGYLVVLRLEDFIRLLGRGNDGGTGGVSKAI